MIAGRTRSTPARHRHLLPDSRRSARRNKFLLPKSGRLWQKPPMTCTSGAVRGVRVVPLATGYGQGLTTTTVTGYTETSADSGMWTPTTQSGQLLGTSNCASTLATPTTDVVAWQVRSW
jgi:hypothetical protein